MEVKKMYFVHGWGDSSIMPPWVSWLKSKCEERGIEFVRFKMPNSWEPKIDEWVGFLKENVRELDEEVLFIGHSIGCQTILRYLEDLDEEVNVGGCVFVAGWLNLLEAAYEDEEDRELAKAWIETPIDFEKVKIHTNNFLSIFSKDDYCVPVSDAEIFREKLGADIIIKDGEEHFEDTEEINEIMRFVNGN